MRTLRFSLSFLSQIDVHFAILGRSRQIFTLDQTFDALLDEHGRGQET